ncbi:MAG: hypothetical protein ACI8X5_000435 [Planctomycetota bacterium]|jgi:hypothetical protein
MLTRLVLLLCLTLSSGLQSCSGLKHMREPDQTEVELSLAPADKALVNVHRPSDYIGSQEYEIYDRTELVTWQGREALWVFVDSTESDRRSDQRQEWAEETLKDFLGGSHKGRLQQLGPNDAR